MKIFGQLFSFKPIIFLTNLLLIGDFNIDFKNTVRETLLWPSPYMVAEVDMQVFRLCKLTTVRFPYTARISKIMQTGVHGFTLSLNFIWQVEAIKLSSLAEVWLCKQKEGSFEFCWSVL